jgi:hypothetical protein
MQHWLMDLFGGDETVVSAWLMVMVKNGDCWERPEL